MTLNGQFDALAQWAKANICDKIKFKKANDEENTTGYSGEYVHPAVFSFFAPRPSDARRLGLDYLVPSCCVQLLSGEDHLSTSMRELRVRLLLAVWNPGLHKDIDTVAYTDLDDDYGFDFHRPEGVTPEKRFEATRSSGAADIRNFLDLALGAVEEDTFPAGLGLYQGVDKEKTLKYGFVWGDDLATEPYPYWYAWIEMTLLSRLEDLIKPDEDLLT